MAFLQQAMIFHCAKMEYPCRESEVVLQSKYKTKEKTMFNGLKHMICPSYALQISEAAGACLYVKAGKTRPANTGNTAQANTAHYGPLV